MTLALGPSTWRRGGQGVCVWGGGDREPGGEGPCGLAAAPETPTWHSGTLAGSSGMSQPGLDL